MSSLRGNGRFRPEIDQEYHDHLRLVYYEFPFAMQLERQLLEICPNLEKLALVVWC